VVRAASGQSVRRSMRSKLGYLEVPLLEKVYLGDIIIIAILLAFIVRNLRVKFRPA
jgi:hypothetical protein